MAGKYEIIGFNMNVKGVALATTFSQAVSAVMIIRCLVKNPDPCRLDFKKLCLDKDMAVLIRFPGS